MGHCVACAVIDPIVGISLFLELDPRPLPSASTYVFSEQRSLGQEPGTYTPTMFLFLPKQASSLATRPDRGTQWAITVQ